MEYSRHGSVIKGQEKAKVKSRYEEDVYVNNHTVSILTTTTYLTTTTRSAVSGSYLCIILIIHCKVICVELRVFFISYHRAIGGM